MPDAQTLRHVLWIGGPPGCGKTTIATRMARRHGLRWYNADTRTWAHRDRALAAGHAAAARWESLTPVERWTTLTPEELLETSLHRERGPMVVDDLRDLPASPLVVAEGSTVSPAVVSSGVAEPSRALWLLPTPEFQRARLDERGLPDGPRTLYLLLAAEIERDVAEHDAPAVRIDGSQGVEEVLALVEERFAAALAEGPRAATRDERSALLREANRAVEQQIRAYFARPWAQADAGRATREFLCECGSVSCDAVVELELDTFAALAERPPGSVSAHPA